MSSWALNENIDETRTMGKYPIAVIPFSCLSPSACAALAAAVDDAIEAFSKWQIPTGVNSKLLKARKCLLKVAEQDSYGTTQTDLIETAKAILLANDFYVISRTLTESRADPIAKELEIALRGPLSEIETENRNAFDILSQFWFGTVLAFSGLHPAVPDSKKTKPDFLVYEGTLVFGVEIKRPQSPSSAVRALSSAASQLRKYGEPGIIVLDVTRSVSAEALILYRGSLSARQLMKSRFDRLASQLFETVENNSDSDKFDRIVVLVVFARFFNWTLGGKEDSDSGFLFKSTVIPTACSGLIVDHSDRIQTAITRGFEKISGNRLFLKRTWK
jgi:hypothetical protein